MSLRVATPELVSQRVRTVLKERPGAGIIAVRAEAHWTDGPLTVDRHRVEVCPCASPLAVRSSLADWAQRTDPNGTGADATDLLVLLCDMADHDLGADVLARLTPPRVLSLEPWDAARSLFGVHRVDAAFGKEDTWVATALLAHVPPEVASSMTVGSTLTREVAFNALARQLLGAQDIGVDAVLDAASGPLPFAQFDGLDDVTRSGLLAAIARASGPLGDLVASVLSAGHGRALLALGLAARAVYGHGEYEGGKAAGKLEAICGNHAITAAVGEALAQRCEETVQKLVVSDRDRANGIVAQAAVLADELQALNPEASLLLPSGFNKRISAAVDVLRSILSCLDEGPLETSSPLDESLARLRAALADVSEHHESETPAGRRRRNHLEMAARLVTWLLSPATQPGADQVVSFEDAAALYANASAWVDRARRRLWRGDDDSDVAVVYRDLLDHVVARRRVENRRFAELLASWTTTPSGPEALVTHGLTTVEAVVDQVLTRFGDLPVLFVVLDGCGLPSFSELAPQFSQAGFREIVATGSRSGSGGAGRRLSAIAALPTVTEVSRASLIAGRLDRGNQDHERQAFEANAAIRRNGKPAAFFHQNRLLGAAGESLSAEVQHALGPDGPAVVGVVINTIDDQLRKGTFTDELRIDDLHALVSLLDAARNNGRVVVISADHGHVLAQPDDGGSGTFGGGGGDGGERWREAIRPPNETEVLLQGDRVRLGGDAGILAPWEDDFRYAAKAGGYHGGATPEEVLVPVAAYLPAGIPEPAGWETFTEVPPLWWELRTGGALASKTADADGGKARRRAPKPVDGAQPAMFELPEVKPEPTSAGVTPGGPVVPGWVDALLASEVWKLQKGMAGRAVLPVDRVRAVLASTVRRGCVISFAALAVDSSVPQARLAGFLANLARVLNVDGYVVLDVDAAAQEVRLVLPTLGQQFQVDVGARDG